MKVTYTEILSANQALKKLMGNGANVNVSPLAALRLARAARVVGQEAEAFEAGRVALIKEIVPDPDEKGNRTIPNNQMEGYVAEINKLTKQEVEINFQAIKLADFGESQLPLTAFYGMEWLISAED